MSENKQQLERGTVINYKS